MRSLSLSVCFLALVGSDALVAQILSPTVRFSVHDQPRDGIGDSFANPGFEGLIRTTSSQADYAMQEFDLAPVQGFAVVSATLSGTVFVNNAFDNGPRHFEFRLYAADGSADLGDFAIPAIAVGTGSYHPPNQSSFTYSFDVTGVLSSLLECGASHVGLQVVGTSSPNFPNILDDATSQLTVTTGAAVNPWTDLGFATPGTHGAARLGGTGTLLGGVPTSLTLCGALPNAPAALLIGFQRLDFPILGTTIVPAPLLVGSNTIGADGTKQFDIVYPPPGGGGQIVYFQYFMIDPGAPQGLAASNAVSAIAP